MRVRYSLRALLGAVIFACLAAAFYGHCYVKLMRRIATINRIRRSGGQVYFPPDRLSLSGGQLRSLPNRRDKMGWLFPRVPNDAFHSRCFVDLSDCTLDDSLIDDTCGLNGIEGISLSGKTLYADDIAERLNAVRSLKSFRLCDASPRVLDILGDLRVRYIGVVGHSESDHCPLRLHSSVATHLSIVQMRITRNSLSSVPNVERLEVARSVVDRDGWSEIAALPGLSALDICSISMGGEGVEGIGRCTDLRNLKMSGFSITDEAILAISMLPKLQRLDLSGTQVGDQGVIHLLQVMGCNPNHVTNRQTRLTEESQIYQLQEINLSYTAVTDEAIRHLTSVLPLENVNLAGTSVSDGCVGHLCEMRRLKHLDLRETTLTDAGLLKLASLEELCELDVSFSTVTSSGVSRLKERSMSPNLEILWYE